jgi:hypothetical protein
LGVEVDEDKVAKYQDAYRKHGEFPTYAGKVVTGTDIGKTQTSVEARPQW